MPVSFTLRVAVAGFAVASCGSTASPSHPEPTRAPVGDAASPFVPGSSAAGYTGAVFGCDVIRQPIVRDMVLFAGRQFATKIRPSGAFEGNAAWEAGTGALSIEAQRNAYFVVAAGVVSTSDRASLLDKGIRALEWGLAQQGVDGSFPAERGGVDKKNNSLHPKSEFIEAAGRALLLVKQCDDIDQSLRGRAAGLWAKLAFSARWLAQSQDLIDFFARAQNTNQLLFAAAALHHGGVLTSDAALGSKAQARMAQILERQTPEGVFPEAGGFDASYQMVSLDLLTHYTSTIADLAYRKALLAAGQRGVDRFLAQVRPDGTIDTSGNTRTQACGPPVPGPGPKGKDIDIIPLRLYQFGFLAGTLARLAPIAERIESVGQGFNHIGDCTP